MPRRPGEFEVSLDTRALSALARDLKGTDLGKSLKRRVRAAAEPVKRAVQAEASFSSRIPGSIAIRASYAAKGAKVRVISSRKKAPHGPAINNEDRAGFFRHPVFGNRDVWVNQPARPFMGRGAERARPQALREIAKVLDDVSREAGFRG